VAPKNKLFLKTLQRPLSSAEKVRSRHALGECAEDSAHYRVHRNRFAPSAQRSSAFGRRSDLPRDRQTAATAALHCVL